MLWGQDLGGVRRHPVWVLAGELPSLTAVPPYPCETDPSPVSIALWPYHPRPGVEDVLLS